MIMHITPELLRKVASNARLSLSEDELDIFLPQLQDVLSFFSCLDEVDVSGVSLLLQPVPLQDVVREDKVYPSLDVQEALKNSPHVSGDYFLGPKTL